MKLDPSLVASDLAVIVLDEYNDTCWVFVGRAVSMPTRMHALRIGKSVQKAGYKIGITNIGMASSNLVEMLEKDDSDPEVASMIAKFKETITKKWKFEDTYLAYDAKFGPAETPGFKPMEEPAVEAAPAEPDVPTVTAETVVEDPEVSAPRITEPGEIVEKKTAYLIYSAVRNAELVYTERFERDGKLGVKIEAPGVMVIEAVQIGNDLKIDPADFGSSDAAKKIKSDYESWLGRI
ncbi:MAG: hypothetical protein ACFE7R_00175 [Candidatus Hodarchaeota archaeon]